MLATDIPKYESSFFKTGKDSAEKLFELTETTVPNNVMSYVKCRLKNEDTSFYYPEKIIKNQIVLHFTVGYLKGDIAALTTPDLHVSTPFIIARNGKILNLWSSAYWSYHLGPSAIGGNTTNSKKTIAIEISNIGYLKKIGNKLVTCYSDTDEYCDIEDTKYYTKLDKPFRGHQYYASFTDAQYESLVILLRYLTDEYNIPFKFLDKDIRSLVGTKTQLESFRGITSHVNYRSSGKWDIGPAFDWDRIINQVK